MSIRELLSLEVGKTLPLARAVGEDLPIYIGSALVGRGELIRLSQSMRSISVLAMARWYSYVHGRADDECVRRSRDPDRDGVLLSKRGSVRFNFRGGGSRMKKLEVVERLPLTPQPRCIWSVWRTGCFAGHVSPAGCSLLQNDVELSSGARAEIGPK